MFGLSDAAVNRSCCSVPSTRERPEGQGRHQELVTFCPVTASIHRIGLNLERLRHVTDLLLPKERKRSTDNLSFFGFSSSKKRHRRLGKGGYTRIYNGKLGVENMLTLKVKENLVIAWNSLREGSREDGSQLLEILKFWLEIGWPELLGPIWDRFLDWLLQKGISNLNYSEVFM